MNTERRSQEPGDRSQEAGLPLTPDSRVLPPDSKPLPPLNRLLRLEEMDDGPDNGEAEASLTQPLDPPPRAAAPDAPLASPINKDFVPKRRRTTKPSAAGPAAAAAPASNGKAAAPRTAARAPQPARASNPSGLLRGWGWPRVVTAIVAVVTLVMIPLIWLEVARINSGAEALNGWIQAGIAPLPKPQGVTGSQLAVQPRRAIRLTNFFGEGQYAYELWQSTPDGSRLAGKYLLGYGDSGFYLLVAFDAGRDAQMTVPASLSPAAAGR